MTKIKFEGPAERVSALAQMLRAEGLEVSFEAPQERRDLGIFGAIVVYLFVKVADVATESTIRELAQKGIDQFKSRFPQGEAEIEDD
jgi:hypothetical protein